MKRPSFKKRQLFVLLVVVFLIVLVGYYHLLLRPKVSRLARLIFQTGQLKSQLRMAHSDISDMEENSQRKKELQKNWDELQMRFLKEGQISSLLEELSGVAFDSGVKIVNIELVKEDVQPLSIERGEKKAAYREVPIFVEARAGFHQLGRFINRLETGQLFVRVEDLKIVGVPDSPSTHQVSFKVCVLVLGGKGH